MRFRLQNQNDPDLGYCLNGQTWFRILALADAYGWNAMGSVSSDWQHGLVGKPGRYGAASKNGDHPSNGKNGRQLVLLDDAINLADALEQAFMEYIPQLIPAYDDPVKTDAQPSMGIVIILIEFCQQGAFWVESV